MDDKMQQRWANRYAVFAPHVRAACEGVTKRHNLTWHERDDLEQEVWLALLIRWRESHAWVLPAIDVSTLALQIGRLLAACRFRNDWREPEAIATESVLPSAADLRIDLADLLARLSPDDQSFCRQWMAEAVPFTHPAAPQLSLFDSIDLRALRPLFEAAGLRAYLTM